MRFYKFDDFDRKVFKISIYTIITATAIYALSGLISSVPRFLMAILNFISHAIGILTPLWVGCIIAYLLYPVVLWVERNLFKEIIKIRKKKEIDPEIERKRAKTRVAFSILVTYVLIIGALTAIITSGFIMIKDKLDGTNIDALIIEVQNYVDEARNFLDKNLQTRLAASNILSEDFKEQITKFVTELGNIGETIFSFILNVLNGLKDNVLNFVLGIVLAFYIMADMNFFKRMYKEAQLIIMPKKYAEKVNQFILEVDGVVSKFIRGQLLDCSIIGVVSIIGLSLIGLEFAFFVGLFVGLSNIIPYFGPIIGAIPAVLIGLISPEPIKALYAVVVLTIIQQIDGNVIAPRIIGRSVGLHPIFILISILIGAQFGFVGLILAVPTAGVVKLILTKIIEWKKIQVKD